MYILNNDDEKEAFYKFVILTTIMIIINVSVSIWSDNQVKEAMSLRSRDNMALSYAVEAFAVIAFSEIASIIVSLASFVIPKTNIIKTFEKLDLIQYKAICILICLLLHSITIYNTISTYTTVRNLEVKSMNSMFDMLNNL
ncbi:MAG: hypothetical protein RR898_06900 [Clostridium sp.]|uniref:hypothetical protein n=1 Tax=Clostridium sp. TaxID=1506 RepID=UPI002FCC2B41